MATPAPTTQVADNSAFGGPNATQAAAANAALAATTPATVPTKAPTGQTSTTAPVSTPTTVVSSQPAAQQVQQKIVPAMQQAQTDIATQNANNAAANNGNAQTYDPATGTWKSFTPTTPAAQTTPAPTPEETIANTPDSGNQWLYDAQGNKIQNPVNQPIPAGYSTTNPTVGPSTPVTNQVTTSAGTTFKQFSDGTYGSYDANGNYIGVAQAQDFNNAQGAATTMASLTQLSNGTYPLTATQQAQIDGLKSQFADLITAQATANANLTGGTTVAENLYGMGNSVSGLGEIKGTIDSGLAKIASLNSQMASAVAAMQQGFQDDDLKMLQASYTMYNDAVTARQSEIDKMTAAATAAATATRDYNLKVQEDAQTQAQNTFQDKMATDTATLDQQKEAYSEYIQNATLTLDQRKEAFAEYTAAQTNTLQTNPGAAGTVSVQADGTISPADQAAYLANLPGGPTGELATVVKGIANYTINPSSVPTRQYKGAGGYTQAQVLALAANYDPSFSQSDYANRQALVKNFTSGSYSQNINALNTAIGHISDLSTSFAGLNNASFTPYNTAKNTIESIFGAGHVTQANTNIAAATGELATAFKNSGATDAEIKSLGSLNSNSSPEQVKDYQASAASLLASRLSALESTYTAGMGKAPTTSFLSTDSQTALLKLQQNGVNIQVPELAKAPVIQLQTFHDADPNNAQLIDSLVQADPSLKSNPQQMVSLLESQGYLQ